MNFKKWIENAGMVDVGTLTNTVKNKGRSNYVAQDEIDDVKNDNLETSPEKLFGKGKKK